MILAFVFFGLLCEW